MIVKGGYSKDKSLRPDGLAVTLPVAFFEDRGTNIVDFKILFERWMRKDEALWNFRLTNLPTHDVAWVYMVFGGFIQYRTNLVQIEKNVSKSFQDAPDGRVREFPSANWLILSGPAIIPPEEIPQKGFQGFRYTYQLF